MNKATKLLAAVAAGVMAVSIAACGGSSSSSGSSASVNTDKTANDNASCTNTIKKTGVEKVTVWAWYPGIQDVVDDFNENHDDLQVCWNNGGQGGGEYTKFQNAIKAGTGAPDVIQLEYEAMPQFMTGNEQHLVDLSQFGFNDYKDDYTAGSWKSVQLGTDDKVYGVPVDLGPFVMYVREDIFKQYGVDVPTTWDEFAEAGKELKAAGYDGYLTDFPLNSTAMLLAFFAQTGDDVYTYSASDPTKVKVNYNSDGAQKVLKYWKELVDEGLVDTTDANTTDWTTNILGGKYATWVQASWQTGYLAADSDDGDADSGFRIYKAPVWDSSTPDVNQGGSAWAVTDQAKDTEAAYTVARELFSSDSAQKIGVTTGGLFPAWTSMLDSDYFKTEKIAFLGDQEANEITIPVAEGYKGYSFLPFQTYAYDEQDKTLKSIFQDNTDVSTALSALDDTLNNYAKQQGYTVE
ncbi:ABC transporter substrate-binding protein [Bifidobacterium choloepi]|uniref:Extracellular solute-binding protein n=1 Tax=Bifidobacterium choloepi TaxID=2614131 RepID=A0A6I5NDG2_9BIFI|nr:extracellular solute-binding protein [Bifidobacterium choloepi]NEG70570.1 extracellular solute-binding protein [Bifidobacterium choloepi]